MVLLGGGEKVWSFLSDIGVAFKVKYVIDNDEKKQGKYFHNIEIIDVNTLLNILSQYNNYKIIIASGSAHIIRNQLLELKVNESDICEFSFTMLETNPTPFEFFSGKMKDLEYTYNLLFDKRSKDVYCGLINYKISRNESYLNSIADNEWDQYFDNELICLSDDESFVDCGAYIGDTLQVFLEKSKGHFANYYCFEADKNIFDELKKNIHSAGYNNIETYNIGCWCKKDRLGFQSVGSGSSQLNSSVVDSYIEVDALDRVLSGRKVSFVKMDIEGAETEAIKGMEAIITAQKPTLAISIYHSLNDFIYIPQIIHKLNPAYKIYIRHYRRLSDSETVCYAI